MTAYLIKGFYGNLPVILMSVTVILLAGILIYVLVRLHREYDMLDNTIIPSHRSKRGGKI